MRVGIMGGTFDPIHIAHLIIAEEARGRLNLSHVIFIPTGDPWLKVEKPLSSGAIRFEMVRLAIKGNPFFSVSDIELRRLGPTYSVDTLKSLQRDWGPAVEAYFIMGIDAVANLHQWRDPALFLELCTPVVFVRPEYPVASLDAVNDALPTLAEKLVLLQGPAIEVSSTDIRRRVAEGRSIRYLVPDEVGGFIREQGLYLDVAGEA